MQVVIASDNGQPITFGDLFRAIREDMEAEYPSDGEFNLERIMFYDAKRYTHIRFNSDDDEVEHSIIRVLVINENLIPFAHRAPADKIGNLWWPNFVTQEELEQFNPRYDD